MKKAGACKSSPRESIKFTSCQHETMDLNDRFRYWTDRLLLFIRFSAESGHTKAHTVTKLLAFGYETVSGKAIKAGSCASSDATTDADTKMSGNELTAAPLGLLALGAKARD